MVVTLANFTVWSKFLIHQWVLYFLFCLNLYINNHIIQSDWLLAAVAVDHYHVKNKFNTHLWPRRLEFTSFAGSSKGFFKIPQGEQNTGKVTLNEVVWFICKKQQTLVSWYLRHFPTPPPPPTRGYTRFSWTKHFVFDFNFLVFVPYILQPFWFKALWHPCWLRICYQNGCHRSAC